MWRRGELLSEHRSNEDNCAILSTDRTREDAVRNSNPLTEVRTNSFIAREGTSKVDDLRALPCPSITTQRASPTLDPLWPIGDSVSEPPMES